MEKGIVSERTVELTIVPDLVCGLKPMYPKVTPLYYWASREGGRISRQSFSNASLRILALYARRPKVEYAGCGIIQIKINQLLIERAHYLKSVGIPAIAGFPLADKVEGLLSGVQCKWIDIFSLKAEETFKIELSKGRILSSSISELSIGDVGRLIDNSGVFSWTEAIETIDIMRRTATSEMRYFPFASGDLYKPVYLLMHMQ